MALPNRCIERGFQLDNMAKDINNVGEKVTENHKIFEKEIYGNGKKGLKYVVSDMKVTNTLKFAGLYAMSTAILGLLAYLVFKV